MANALTKLADPGPPRSAAIVAVERELHLALGMCGDRKRTLAARIVTVVANSKPAA